MSHKQAYNEKMIVVKLLGIVFSIFAGLLMSSSHLSATHYGGPPSFNKDNIRNSRGSSIYSTTKNSSSSSSSTTQDQYDPYANFLRLHFDEIQEQVAQGGGPHTEVIARFNSCGELLLAETNLALSTNYKKIFKVKGNPDLLREAIKVVIKENDKLRDHCESFKKNT